MLTLEKISMMTQGEAIHTLKRVGLSNASSERKKPLIEALEKRIRELDRSVAMVEKASLS